MLVSIIKKTRIFFKKKRNSPKSQMSCYALFRPFLVVSPPCRNSTRVLSSSSPHTTVVVMLDMVVMGRGAVGAIVM